MRSYKESLLKKAFRNFTATGDYSRFERKHSWWLEKYALFMALQEANRGVAWTKFDPRKNPSQETIRYHKFEQYEFFRQWQALHKYCGERNISIMGDMSFYVEHNSADVWSNRELFDLRRDGESRYVGGVPPDYFSKDGQLWGTPVYRWDKLAATRLPVVDQSTSKCVRIGGFVAAGSFSWLRGVLECARGSKDGEKRPLGEGAGARLFDRVRKELGDIPFVAENLGTITPEVEELRQRFGLPGMAVLQFGLTSGARTGRTIMCASW